MRVYVGTYAKYNNGSIFGKWLDVEDYADYEEFNEACLDLHKDEHDCELMFQDWEDIPDSMICESSVSCELWELMDAIEASYLGKDVFWAGLWLDIPFDKIEDAYAGHYPSDEEFAEQLAEDCGLVDENASWPNYYIDWSRAAFDLMVNDYQKNNGYYFSRNW